jgi:hypothetical protein
LFVIKLVSLGVTAQAKNPPFEATFGVFLPLGANQGRSTYYDLDKMIAGCSPGPRLMAKLRKCHQCRDRLNLPSVQRHPGGYQRGVTLGVTHTI